MDVPSDFMHTTMGPKYPKVHMALQGKLEEIMVKVYPNLYREFVSTDSNGSLIFYVEMKKVLYVIIKPALPLYLNMV